MIFACAAACRAAPPPAAAGGGAALIDATPQQLMGHISGSQAKVVILNVWSTWCEPCKEELPDFVRFAREHRARGVELVLLSTDFPDKRADAELFLRSLGVDFATYLKSGGDQELIEAVDPAWSGALPVTAVYAGGSKRWFFEGRVSYEVLEREVASALAAP